MTLVKDGKFNIPLYHGTSGLFIDSIKEFGLGGKDPLVELGAKEFIKDLFLLAEDKLQQDNHWSQFRESIRPTVNQDIVGGIFSFKHGNSYLTYNPELAVKYAVENICGCEQLTNTKKLLILLQAKEVEGLEELLTNPIVKVLEKPHDPYLITLKNVKVENVETETGKPMNEQLNEIENLRKFGILGPESFSLKYPINTDDFLITRLGHYYMQNDELRINWDEGDFTNPETLKRIID